MIDPLFVERLSVPVTGDFQEAVRTAAKRSGLTIADYTRISLSDAMMRDGVKFQPLPQLSRSGPSKTKGRR